MIKPIAMKDYKLHHDTERRRYEFLLEDGSKALLEYVIMPDDTITLTHTEVPYAFSNRGIGTQLVGKVLEDIKSRGGKINPQCGFVAAYVRRHPECKELVAVHEEVM